MTKKPADLAFASTGEGTAPPQRPKTTTPREARQDKRVSIVQEIECEGPTGKVSKRVADISVGGMFIDGLREFEPESLLVVRFCLADRADPIEATARVVYVQGKTGTGVQFVDLKPEDRAKILEVVVKLSSWRRYIGGERGKISRVMVRVPVILSGTEKDGDTFEEKCAIVTLAKNGVSVRTHRSLVVDDAVFLQTPKGAIFEGRVIWQEKDEIWVQCRGLSSALGFHFP